jgi:NAD(P)-dependent dehydrogenase (short-subunit alcohol dehydrogenase family)
VGLAPDSILLGGRRAIVTGAAQGIGRAAALALARFGADVAVCDRDAAGLDAVAREVKSLDRVVVTGVLDVRDQPAVEAFVGEARLGLGAVDVVVNNAGGGFEAAFDQLTDGAQRALVDENFTSVTNVIRATAPHLERGSVIVNVSSIEAHRAAPGFAVYAAMKAAVENLTASLALELGVRGVRVCCVAPDVITTPGVGPLAGVTTPLGGVGDPDDVAAAIVFLASPMARFVTGTTLHVDGGNHAASGWRRGADGRWSPS